MFKQGEAGFKYYVGVRSLADIATRRDQVCVLNVLGGESRAVTPISHAYSGGNVVFGTAPGKRGEVLGTPIGDIPVFDNVREGLDAGYHFDTGVVYLPPAHVRHGFYELVRVNRNVKKVVIVTEKVPVHDARAIRAVAQQLGIDVFGANCLGVADSWNQVRIGGALGGDTPEESLRKGSVAIFSNSGNFTTTIANYLQMSGWGTTTLISSGKDAYIHFAAPEFAHAFAHDPRSKAAVMYVEPGGYYEQGLTFTKPVIACVVGKWKAQLTRAVGHAGAIAGSGDDAEAKIRWFVEALGVDGVYTPDRPHLSPKGAVVGNIAHIPLALNAVMKRQCLEPDFAPRGNLDLEPWFVNDQGLDVPEALRLPAVTPLAPYDAQVQSLDRQVGAYFARERMKDASGASRMDPETHVTSVHGVPVLQIGQQSFTSALTFALTRTPVASDLEAIADVALLSRVNLHGRPERAAIAAAADAGSPPNVVLAAAACLVGPRRVAGRRRALEALLEIFGAAKGLDVSDPVPEGLTASKEAVAPLRAAAPDEDAQTMLTALSDRGARSVFVRFLVGVVEQPSADAVHAALALSLAWGPLTKKRISRLTALSLPWHLELYATMLGASLPADAHEAGRLAGLERAALLREGSVTELSFLALTGRRPAARERVAYQALLGLLVSNGPGTISAQGAKGAVSADGPETPERVQLNKAAVGFLTHTGFSHGGNGYEGVAFLRARFAETGLEDPTDPDHGIDLRALARAYARAFAEEKAAAKAAGEAVRAIPGINHPVFKGQPVNVEPRERFIRGFMEARGDYNAFHDFYRHLVEVLHEEGVTPNVFCVNVDAVISALLFEMLWSRHRDGTLSAEEMERAAFVLFLYGRMIGCAAEVDDHLNRGRNMDTRTPQAQCRAVT